MTTETKRQMAEAIPQADFASSVQDSGARPDAQSVFFFDGDFRTWPQVEHRARLNGAISTYIARTRLN